MKENQEERKMRKVLCGLYYADGKVGFEDIYYPGMFDALDADEASKLRNDPEYCHAVGDEEHPDLLVTDDADFLADRLTSEWGDSLQDWAAAGHAAYQYIEMMANPDCKLTQVKIDGLQFGVIDISYIHLSVYTKELVYDKRTQKYLDKIKKELAK